MKKKMMMMAVAAVVANVAIAAVAPESAEEPNEQVGYSVGRISETEYVLWKQGKLYRVLGGVPTEQSFMVVTEATDWIGSNGWYVVSGVITRNRNKIDVNGTANLVLLHNASLTVSEWWHGPGILVTHGNTLNVFGVESGCLTANGGDFSAGIGGGDRGTVGTVTINGGSVTAQGGNYSAGIGGGHGGDGADGDAGGRQAAHRQGVLRHRRVGAVRVCLSGNAFGGLGQTAAP